MPKADILAFLDGQTSEPLEPRPISLLDPELSRQVYGFQGF
ncbi:MAG: hypothetical protein AAGA46_04560 [Cyanobacteria bacterium P01_F01_bin.13]